MIVITMLIFEIKQENSV